MRTSLQAAYDWVMGRDLFTWIGHGLLGALMYLLFHSFAVVFVAFLYRELSDLLAWWRDPRQVWDGAAPVPRARKPPFSAKAADGFMDLWAPLAGAGVVAVVLGLLGAA